MIHNQISTDPTSRCRGQLMTNRSYSRRTFLQTAGLAASAAFAASLPTLHVSAAGPQAITARLFGRQYRGTSDGYIFESLDDGRSWQQVAKFGPQCAILALNEHQGTAYAQVGVGAHQFVLTSADAHRWHSARVARK